MRRFQPRLDVLPPAQSALWRELAGLEELGWVLYGGTAIALRLGHRASADFDFFSDRALERGRLGDACPLLRRLTVLQDRPDTLTVLATPDAAADDGVKVSFFGGIGFGRVGDPEVTSDGVLQVASLDDLLANKVKVLLQRVDAKDYLDIARPHRIRRAPRQGAGVGEGNVWRGISAERESESTGVPRGR